MCWSKEILPKAGTFAWLAIQGKILIGDRRRKFGFQGPIKCVMCGKEKESANHLLLNCDIVAQCWRGLQGKLGWSGLWSPSLKAFFISWPRVGRRNVFEYIWKVSPSIVIWEVRKERNRRIFLGTIKDN